MDPFENALEGETGMEFGRVCLHSFTFNQKMFSGLGWFVFLPSCTEPKLRGKWW